MALIQTSLIWVTYAVAIAILLAVVSIFVFLYQKPSERAPSVTTVCIITTSALLATVLLMPVDVALVSSTSSIKEGRKKDWADESTVANMVYTLRVVYYLLYSLDAILCLIVVPFTYFYYEEYDEIADEEHTQTLGDRLWGATKYTLGFIIFVVLMFLVGFFAPAAKKTQLHDNKGLDYFKDVLKQTNAEHALTFAIGLLITIGTFLYVLYTGAGLALLPVALIKSAPSLSVPALASNTADQLQQNRERQRQLEGQNEGRQGGLDSRDRRELESLVREERTLIRRERLAAEAGGKGQSALVQAWTKIEAVFRPVKLLGGLVLVVVALIIWVSMLITAIDKASNSICRSRCGYVLAHIHIFQPVNWLLTKTSKIFPIDYIIFLLLVLFFFSASVVGIATAGIRFLWIVIFKVRKGQTSPQAMLLATVMLTLMTLAINFAIAVFVAPEYATFGPQTYCDREPHHLDGEPDCSERLDLVRPCTESTNNLYARKACTPSVASKTLNSVTINWPFFGMVEFWAQFVFLAVYLIVFITTLLRTPKMNTDELDADLEEAEEEGLLASTGRRFNATWQDIFSRSQNTGVSRSYGTTSGGGAQE